MTTNRIAREDLYEAVWAKPMTAVGALFGLSGTTLKKICDRWDIPTPERGHWSKLAHGTDVRAGRAVGNVGRSWRRATADSVPQTPIWSALQSAPHARRLSQRSLLRVLGMIAPCLAALSGQLPKARKGRALCARS